MFVLSVVVESGMFLSCTTQREGGKDLVKDRSWENSQRKTADVMSSNRVMSKEEPTGSKHGNGIIQHLAFSD